MKLRIKDMRLERGWTVHTLAEKVGMSRSYVSEIENGRKAVNNHRIAAFAKAFGISPVELVEDTGNEAELLQDTPQDGCIYPDVAMRVRWHRAYLGLTQEEYGNRVGAGRTQVKNWEMGTTRPKVDVALKMRNAYGLTLEWLYAGEDAQLPLQLLTSWRSRPTAT